MKKTITPAAAGRKKNLLKAQGQENARQLSRSLSGFQLLCLGVGIVVGSGVYVITGTAAAQFAGPAVVLSFALAALACLCTALSYAELASAFPVMGAAYAYAYISIGEKTAWLTGWLLLMEFCLAASAISTGFAGYLAAWLSGMGIHLPLTIRQSTILSLLPGGLHGFSAGPRFNLVAALTIAAIGAFLTRGVQQSARLNTAIVVLKISLLALFVIIGVQGIQWKNLHPFIPPSEGNFHYGIPGIFQGASLAFFGYLGFEAVATAAAETRNPKKDIPFGLLGCIAVCGFLYVVVAGVLVGIVPYRELNVPDPLSVATARLHLPWLAVLINAGATVGLSTGVLGCLYAATRLMMALGDDGLIPKALTRLSAKTGTPNAAILTACLFSAGVAGLMPLDVTGDLVSLTTASAFIIVGLTAIWARNSHPHMERPFRTPGKNFRIGKYAIPPVPVLGIISSLIMGGPILIHMIRSALSGGNALPFAILLLYLLTGVAVYLGYGRKHSHAGRESDSSELLP